MIVSLFGAPNFSLSLYTHKEESSEWAERAINVASVTEDADAITEMHDAVLGKTVFAVDGPDGEHDLENLVSWCMLLFLRFANVYSQSSMVLDTQALGILQIPTSFSLSQHKLNVSSSLLLSTKN